MRPRLRTLAASSQALSRKLVGRAASSGALALLRLAKWAAPPSPRTRSADLPCRCGHPQNVHLPAMHGGCRHCPCSGFALTPREELNAHARATAAGHPSAANWPALLPEPPTPRGGIRYPARETWTPDGPGPVGYGCPVIPLFDRVPLSYPCPRCRQSGEERCTHPRGA